MDKVILVDNKDRVIGSMDKMEVHRKGILHRAFSIILFDSKGNMLLQKRAKNKYHSGGLWTNTCCSHPRPDEDIQHAVNRRLKEEMGIVLSTRFLYKFIYKADLNANLVEHEMDHVFTGTFDGTPIINTSEVEDWKFESIPEIQKSIQKDPSRYSPWFLIIMKGILEHL